MFAKFARVFFGTSNERSLKAYQKRLPEINQLEPEIQALDDVALANKTVEFRQRLADGETLDNLLPEAFAVVREASKRVLGMRHFDVQLIGGMVLHDGKVAEMRTGEGKTLVATLAVYLNALSGKGVHVVTVNDYLASRDAAEMGRLYSFLGMNVGTIIADLSDIERKAAYAADITYGTNNEFGFDYLRDNMKYSLDEMVQRPFNYAIVDEVDSILIDEARTPLIISGVADDSSDLYRSVNEIIKEIVKDPANYEKDEKFRNVIPTEMGTEHIEQLMREKGVLKEGGLYDTHNIALVHHMQQALRAHTLFARDVDYIVRNNKVILIDEFTGRMMDGRRYSDGLHQALEAKEHVEIQQENQTLASITFQNYFRLYPKLAGMTGTAMTEADEFAEIYKLDVVSIPTNLKVQRKDEHDEIYLTAAEKYDAVSQLIEEVHKKKQPILVGTTSIEKSEHLSNLLNKKGIKHNVLNARFHEKEAQIVAQAGVPGAITIATNMAGRGTDIKLGGNVDMLIHQQLSHIENEDERLKQETALKEKVQKDHELVKESGGLFVIGTERHESRRIDNQLRGRSGRQGDPGNSRFFLSLEDDLMRIFGSERMGGMLQKMGLKKGEAIVHPWINKALEKAQKKVEARNFDMRKNTLKYDDVINDQRKEVYSQRREYMALEDVSEVIASMRHDVINMLIEKYIPEKSFAEQWHINELTADVKRILNLDLPIKKWSEEKDISIDTLEERITKAANEMMATKVANYGVSIMRYVEKQVLLTTLDSVWKEHLLRLDQMRQGIGLRAYGQKDPLNEYKKEAFVLFNYMLDELRERITSLLAKVEVNVSDDEGENSSSDLLEEGSPQTLSDAPKEWADTPRNAPCPCGSGKKFKHCHGRFV
ncbi:preprotein translocase subunit SecA [Commensalibacter sp. M0402]|uniref:preprotein translocase subunit SecA n=1 Tax=Commensalibacter TaxID=1079922 RepID=UPI0018DD5843|nr:MULTISPECIES: preprotein translocase subunit SecA [Commensalibacter]MBI0082990.1 preprotein translocase subunit SecA [Commensalibacter sp. W6292M3]MBI0088192.1 preprotein translocase subunit SecA [Commensalibacter melissae]